MIKLRRIGSIGGIVCALFLTTGTRAGLIYFDNFSEFPPDSVLTQTNYPPPLGAAAEIDTNENSGENSTTATATNLFGTTWLLFAAGTPPYQARYQGTPTLTPITQVVTESFTLWIPSTQSTNSIGGLGVNVLSTNLQPFGGGVTNFQDQPLVFINDGGQIIVFTNTPSPQSLIQIGSWPTLAGTAMTNTLVLDYPAGTFSFSVNGSVLTNMPIPSFFTNFFDVARLLVTENIPDSSLGNTFAVGNVTLSTPTPSTNQDVSAYVVASKSQLFSQSSATTVTLLTTGFFFLADADGAASNAMLAATDLTPGGSNLVLSSNDPSEDTFKFQQLFTTKAAMDAAFPTGMYTMSFVTVDDGTLASALNLPADDYPNPPKVSNYSAAQVIDPSNDFTLVWGAFTNGTTNDAISVEIDDQQNNTVTNSPAVGEPGELDGTVTNFVIAANTLTANAAYTGILRFIKISTRTTNAVAGALGIAGYSEETQFSLIAAGTTVCAFAISPTNTILTAAGGAGIVNVTAPNGCPWTATNNDSFITITSGASGSGNGSVHYSVAANTNAADLSGSLTIAGQTFAVSESGTGTSSGCTFTLSKTNILLTAKGGAKNVSFKAKGANCSWIAVSNDPFITITAGASGTGNGKVNFTVPGNTNTTPLSGTITIAGKTFTVNQAAGGCTFKLSPATGKLKSSGGSATVKVTPNLSDCAWTAITTDSFITIESGSSGTGKGIVAYTVPANTTTNPVTGTIVIGGQTFTVIQAGIK
ncbi:MAG TPA: BACON domain-containing carbohydrate-binding protein [Verrucomicrobiae bacterium]|nr:BACON domain-containing carbohydrate-binding protein [Verrucomicrobiae bacterium]